MRMRVHALALATTAALLTAACGGAPPTTSPPDPAAASGSAGQQQAGPSQAEQLYQEIGGLSGESRRNRLVELAEKEGELNLYTSMTSEVADAVTEEFSDKFGIDVNLYRAGSETVLQRILQEQKANFRGNDLVETNATELFALQQENVLAPYQGARRDLVPDAGKFETWTATRFNLFAPSWNTKLVKQGEQPKSWEDLADPKWDGKLSMEVGDYDWYLSLYGYWQQQGKSTAEIDKLFQDMASGSKVVKGHTVQGELMSAGQFAVTASNYTYLVEQQRRSGAPVAYQPLVEPVIARPNGFGLMRTAEHPAAALLFSDWLLEEGQKVLAEQGLTPAIAQGGDDVLKGVKTIPVDVKRLVTEGEQWSKRYEELLSRGEKTGS